MKIKRQTRQATRGSAVLVVMVLLACIATIVVANTQTLFLLKQELKHIDQKQQQRYGQGAGR